MNPKTKKTTNLPRSKLGIAGAVFSLWAIAVYSAGLLNPLQASQDTTLKVNGVQNHVQYLTSLVITGTKGNVEFKYDQATNSVQALGALNMQNIVIEDKNAGNTASNPSAVILGGTGNTNNGQNSVIIGGERTVNGGQNNLLINTPNSNAQSFNTAIIRGEWVTTNGKNIFVNNSSSKDINGENIFINGSSSSKGGNNVAIFGSKVNNTKRNVFIFNGNNAEFNPNLDSAFYANGKVAINGSNAVGTLHVHGGVMVQNRREKYDIPDQSGIIALFSRGGQTGLCGYDGLRNRRVPLSESARLYGLCVKTEDIARTRPANSVSNWETIFPQVWNQNPWVWESPKWIYGHKNKPQRFICDKGYYPDRADPIWKTGVSCIPCQGAEVGDLTCETNKGDNSAPPVLKCPDGYESSTNTEICIKKTKCIKNPNSEWVVGLTYDEQIEEYNMNTQITSVTQKCDIKCDEAKGYKYVAWDPSSSDLNLRNAHCAKSKVEKYQWKCEQKTTWNPFGWTCKKRYGGPNWDWSRYRGCEGYTTEESCRKPKHRIGPRKSSYCYWEPSWSTIVNTTTTYTCTDKNTGAVVDNTFCQDLTKPTDCSITIPVKPLYRCLWGVEYGHLIEWDDEWLSQDTYSTLVSANTSAKCEYVCNDGYEIVRSGWISHRGRVRTTGLPICKKKKLAPLNWSCDIANRWCTTGIKTARQEAPTAFTWTCAGENWGTNVSCKKEKDMSTENPVEPCQTTKIREYSQNSHSFIEKYLQVWAFVDPGCSIKNIQYSYQRKCNDGDTAKIGGNFDPGPIGSNTVPKIIENLNNLRLSAKSEYKNKIVGIEFTYDVYQGSKMVRSGSFSFDQKYCEDGFLGAKRCIREKQCGSSSNWD